MAQEEDGKKAPEEGGPPKQAESASPAKGAGGAASPSLAGFADPKPVATKNPLGSSGWTSSFGSRNSSPVRAPPGPAAAGDDGGDDGGGNSLRVTPAAEALLGAIPAGSITGAALLDEDDADDGDDDAAMADAPSPGRAAAVAEARRAAGSLNQAAMLSAHEARYAALERERDRLRGQLESQNELSARHLAEQEKLRGELSRLRTRMDGKSDDETRLRARIQAEKRAGDEARSELTSANERSDRAEREADSLRAEIARLAKSNEGYQSTIAAMTTEHSKSSSEAVPLRMRVKRLESELDAVGAHCTYLEGELDAANGAAASLRSGHGAEVRSMRAEADSLRLSLEQRERELQSARMSSKHAGSEVERLQLRIYDLERAHTDARQKLENDLDKERDVVALKEQKAALLAEQNEALQRELDSVKRSAAEIASEGDAKVAEARGRIRDEVEEATARIREEEGARREDLERRLADATEARARMEEDVLASSPARRIAAGPAGMGSPPVVGAGNLLTDGEPLSLTDLYSRLAATEDDLRSSQHENKKLVILMERIHRDIAAKTPLFRQRQVELESALEELEEANERLDHARREASDARADNSDLEMRLGSLERENGELARSARDLASQVQSLLRRRAAESGDVVTFDDVSGMQAQNERLLKEHHAMSSKISELEKRIEEDPATIEAARLKAEVVSLREEREKQSKLVAGIVHQRDLYRALVAKNDEGEGQLTLADERARDLPAMEMRNRDLAEETSKLRADANALTHERDALHQRLARGECPQLVVSFLHTALTKFCALTRIIEPIQWTRTPRSSPRRTSSRGGSLPRPRRPRPGARWTYGTTRDASSGWRRLWTDSGTRRPGKLVGGSRSRSF